MSLISEGAKVAICARSDARIRDTATQIGAVPFACDLTPKGAATTLTGDVLKAMGGIDILVVNTGGPPTGTFDSLADDSWGAAVDGLFLSAIELIRGALPGMRQRGWGRILIVTSVAATEPHPGLILSNAIRPALHGLVNALSREVAGEGVTVNAILPGLTRTERLEEIGVSEATVKAQVPAGRMGTPEEFAALATFVASDPAAYITGQAIACDGGLLRSI
jgi:3-oxoacyl-[acyl-carrier protein] reductase